MKKLFYIIVVVILIGIYITNQLIIKECNTGKVYHKLLLRSSFCYGLDNCRSGTHFTTIFVAKKEGKRACRFCYGR